MNPFGTDLARPDTSTRVCASGHALGGHAHCCCAQHSCAPRLFPHAFTQQCTEGTRSTSASFPKSNLAHKKMINRALRASSGHRRCQRTTDDDHELFGLDTSTQYLSSTYGIKRVLPPRTCSSQVPSTYSTLTDVHRWIVPFWRTLITRIFNVIKECLDYAVSHNL